MVQDRIQILYRCYLKKNAEFKIASDMNFIRYIYTLCYCTWEM